MKKAILFIGLPGSGKTTYINENIKGYYIVSADQIKMLHPQYTHANTETLHEWSVREAEIQMQILSDDATNICMDSGGVNNSYSLRIINMLKDKGYHIEIIFIDTPLDVCLERNRGRDRQVPESAIIDKSKKIYECAEKQKTIADNFKHIIYEVSQST
jgi:predicted kinase